MYLRPYLDFCTQTPFAAHIDYSDRRTTIDAARADGIAEKTLHRGRKRLRITREDGRVVQQNRKHWWRLPEELMDEANDDE